MKGNRLFSRRFGYMLIFPSAIVFLIVSIYPNSKYLSAVNGNNAFFSE